MKLKIVQEFEGAPHDVIAAYRSRGLYESFHDLPFVGDAEMVKHVPGTGDDTAINHMRWAVELQLPAAARMFVDADRLSFVEQMTLEADGTGRFTVVPDHYPKLLRFSGITSIAATPSGATRTTQGELRIDLGWKGKLFEGEVEQAIAGGLTRALHAQAPQVEAFIATS